MDSILNGKPSANKKDKGVVKFTNESDSGNKEVYSVSNLRLGIQTAVPYFFHSQEKSEPSAADRDRAHEGHPGHADGSLAPPAGLAAKLDMFRANGRVFREHEELFTETSWLSVMVVLAVENESRTDRMFWAASEYALVV